MWKARRIAQATALAADGGAAAVDRALYFVAARCSYAEIDRQVEKARAEHDPVETERRRIEAAEKRHVKTHLGAMTYDGWSRSPRWPTSPTRSRSRTTSPPGPPSSTRRSRPGPSVMVLGMLGGRHGDTPGEEGSAPG